MQSAHFGGRRREFAPILIGAKGTVHRRWMGIWRFVGGGGRQMPLEQPIQTLLWSKPALYPGAKTEGAVYNETAQDGNTDRGRRARGSGRAEARAE